MNSNGPKSSEDPKWKTNDPTKTYTTDPNKPYGNESASQPGGWPHAENKSSSYESSGPSYTQETNRSKDQGKSTTEQISDKFKDTGEKLKDTFKNIKDSPKVDELYNYAVTNKEKTITYIALVLGLIILLFINTVLGGLILGLLAGYYFSREIVDYIRGLPQFFESQDQLRYAVLAGLIIGLLVAAPGILIGAAVMAAFRYIINRNDREDVEFPRSNNNGKKGNNGNKNQFK